MKPTRVIVNVVVVIVGLWKEAEVDVMLLH